MNRVELENEHVLVSVLEIARLALTEDSGDFEYILEHLDISDEEGDILVQKINSLLNYTDAHKPPYIIEIPVERTYEAAND